MSRREPIANTSQSTPPAAQQPTALEKSAAYNGLCTRQAVNRLSVASTAKLKEIADEKGYIYQELAAKPDALAAALDDLTYALADLSIMPTAQAIAIWLHVGVSTINALCCYDDTPATDVLRAYKTQMVNMWITSATLSDKPTFQMFWLQAQTSEFNTKIDINHTFEPRTSTESIGNLKYNAELYLDGEIVDVDVHKEVPNVNDSPEDDDF